jgi:hypothetical protein
MRLLVITAFIMLITWTVTSCGSSSTPTFCDTACITAPLKFIHPHPDTPYVTVTVKNCKPDTLLWSHKRLETVRKQGFFELVSVVDEDMRLNKEKISCYFKDTSYAWLKFNDCRNGRGYLVKLPYSKSDKWSIYTSALNDFDPKFDVQEGLIAYYDETFIYVQDQETGKLDRMLMNNTKLDIDHNNVHGTFDSVNITRDRIWANIKIKGSFQPKEKKIELK